jgi:hypothetical protein
MNKLKYLFKGQAVSHITHFYKIFFKLRMCKKFYLCNRHVLLDPGAEDWVRLITKEH